MNLIAALLLAAGAVSIVAGVALWSPAAALVVAGLLLATAGVGQMDLGSNGRGRA